MSRRSGFRSLSACAAALVISSVLVRAEVVADPDLTGLWTPIGRGASGEGPRPIRFPSDAPYTARGQALWDAYAAEFDPVVDAPGRFCVHPGMPGSMIGTPTFPMEIFHREQDVTLFLEAYYQYRKIYIEGHDRPEPILPTRMGYSVGRWEGDTLVVETTHLSERGMVRSLMSDEARIIERIHVETDAEGRRLLVDDITLTDPQIYTEPVVMRGVWVHSPDSPIMEYICSQNLFDAHIRDKRAAASAGE